MSQETNNPDKEQEEVENNSIENLANKSPEEQASFAQGGQPKGHSQGGQGGNQQPHGGENPRHDEADELSEFAREDS